MEDRRGAAVLGTAAALCGLPVLADLVLSWRHAPFRYFTSDTYYYLNVARNAAKSGLFSFDGERPTNGFHPLWQALLALLDKGCLLAGVSELTFCTLVVVLGACLTTLAVVVAGRTIRRARGSLPAAFALLPVGLYALLLVPAWIWAQDVRRNVSPAEGPLPLHGTLWSYVNGMESGLALFAFAVFMSLAVAGPPRTARAAGLLGLAGAFVVLARLDQVFLAAAVLAVWAVRLVAAEGRASFGRVLAMGAGLGAPVVLYLLVNLSYCGRAFPVSGAAKFTFAAAGRSNVENLAGLLREGPGAPYWLDRVFRLAQLLIPAAAAAAFLVASVRAVRTRRGPRLELRRRDELSLFLAATAAGVLALCGAVFLFTQTRAYGSWSLPVPVLFVSLAALGFLAGRPAGARGTLRLAGCAAASLAVFAALHRQPEHHEKYRRLYERRGAVAAAYGAKPPRVVEMDDGIVGFATGFHTLSGFGFAADPELLAAIRAGRLLPLARGRGFDRIASLVYLPPGANPGAALRFLASSYRDDSGAALCELEYYDPALPFAIARISWPPAAPP